MNWEAITLGIEVVGLLLVIATLIYLAVEIRQNTDSVNTARYETITTGFNDIDAVIVADPELAHLIILALEHPDQLSEKEQARTAFVFRMFHNQYYKIFHLYRTGVLSESEWLPYAKQCGQFWGSAGGLLYLKHNTDYPDLEEAIRPYMNGDEVMRFAFTEGEPPNNKSLETDA